MNKEDRKDLVERFEKAYLARWLAETAIRKRDYDEAKAALLAALSASPSPVDSRDGLIELERKVRRASDAAYCASLNKFSSTPCLGWEAKVSSGKFGKDEMEAHAEANKLMGRHQGLAEAIKLISAALLAAKEQQP